MRFRLFVNRELILEGAAQFCLNFAADYIMRAYLIVATLAIQKLISK